MAALASFKTKLQNQFVRTFAVSATKCAYQADVQLPKNVEAQQATQRATYSDDRSRDISSHLVNVYSKHYPKMTYSSGSHDIYDLHGNVNLSSIVHAYVPDPYNPVDEHLLKEGVPRGLSDCVRERGQRWIMQERLEIARQHQGKTWSG